LNAKLQEVYADIYTMRVELERTRKPLGTRDNPVRTCRDLFYGHPHFKDDWYWIDPNLGMPDDAVYVFCNLTNSGETCIYPETRTTRLRQIAWAKHPDKRNPWFSTFHQGFSINYGSIGDVQMTFLSLLHGEAKQNFTYICSKSVAWFDSAAGNYNSSIKFLGNNDQEFSYSSHPPKVIRDGCKDRQEDSKTIFEFKTKKSHQLPIVDFLPIDYGDGIKSFGFEVGPVCFR
jgi:collagen type V/XI/XXIV/XXVII alpha